MAPSETDLFQAAKATAWTEVPRANSVTIGYIEEHFTAYKEASVSAWCYSAFGIENRRPPFRLR